MALPPNTDNFTIGKGILFISPWDGTTPPTGWTDMGNAPSIEVEHAIERLPHYSSRSSYKLKDKSVVLQKDYTVNFTLDELAAANLALFIMGTTEGGVIHALQATEKEYALKFKSDNPTGPNRVWEFWRATLSPSGPLTLIGEEWMQMAFTAEGLADIANHPNSPYYDVGTTTTTSTTTTSSTSTTSTTTTA